MFDKDLKTEDIQSISTADEVANFFTILGYNTSGRINQTAANLDITNESLVKEIRKIDLIADQEGLFQVYLFELSSVTVANTQGLVRLFRNRAGNYLLVLTSDYNRIDFVLIERGLPKDEKDKTIAKKQTTIRPRVLTVDRLKPTRINLRVLKRFTNTESDPIAQYEKLQAAYIVADWSEEFFNNRALFSDYYLLERLRDEPEWKENVKTPYSSFRALYQDARSQWSGKSEKAFRMDFLEKIFEYLGFKYKECKAPDDDSKNPDYTFFEKSASGKPLSHCLTYSWGRSLDGKDYTRDKDTPDENPGAVVVSLLDTGDTDWVIVTNGKIWRLYSSKAHSRATNYYEIDLEEVMARLDPEESFRYFYLFFRKEAFVVFSEKDNEAVTFLDRLLKGSEDYAKKLGERLKKRVFEHIFPHFSEGFINYMRSTKGLSALSDADLDDVYHGTLTFLYRLLFILYSESRNLLPVKEFRGYYEISLAAIKSEIADKLGDVTVENIKQLSREKLFDANTTGLYDRLTTLFKAIDSGNVSLNVPPYNGGLFMMDADDEDTHEARNAAFLHDHKIPDLYLAYGLDLLARDEDDKTFKRVFIDYKSLGVRQLGSIYEGLLEFHVRIASEKMAICKGKKTEEVVPYKTAIKEKRKILTTGRGKNAGERTLPKGAVYLENTKHERKATGSYYTPDYIVKYIVENTVGPVLKDKFQNVTPKFREAQMSYREAVNRKEAMEKRGMQGDDPEKTAFTYGHLVDELFDVKVLDPAMGSGHFLVDAVDFITDKMIDFLNGFPWNPVLATIRETRETILKEMESRGITIDEIRLNDLNLLKRHVLKRCIYGVDLNPMAVELAKVSLWLDCFTLGAPLSFLDHHLKCGNSLIGATVDEVKKALHEDQLGLFGSRFAGLMLATDLMRHVGELSDVTAAQVKESRSEYKKASDSLAPFRRILDVYVSQWFGNEGKSKGNKKKSELSPPLEFLQSDEAEAFINARDLNNAVNKLSASDRKIVQTAMNAVKEKRFFHWELEFPEVFYEKGKEKENPGFDAVIGNPPYVNVEEIFPDDRDFLMKTGHYSTTIKRMDIFIPFHELSIKILKNNGSHSFIVPFPILTQDYGQQLRIYFLDNTVIRKIVDLSKFKIFPDATVRNIIPILKKQTLNSDYELEIINQHEDPNKIQNVSGNIKYIDASQFRDTYKNMFRIDITPDLHSIQMKIDKKSLRFGKIFAASWGARGVPVEKFHLNSPINQDCKKMIKGNDIERYNLSYSGKWLLYDIEKLYRPSMPEFFENSKIVFQKVTGEHSLIGMFEENKFYTDDSLICCIPKFCFEGYDGKKLRKHKIYIHNNEVDISKDYDILYILALMNSKINGFYFSKFIGYDLNVYPENIEYLPIPIISFNTLIQEREKQKQKAIRLYNNSENENILKWVEREQLENRKDSIHDFLAFLANQMIRMQKTKTSNTSTSNKLKQTDELIDQIVYKLYGLTEEEIKIVEGTG